MLSEGSREIEGARKRLAAAKTQVSSAKMMMEQAKAMLNSAQTLSDTADKEFKEAQTALEEAEKRWEVIDIDMDDSVVSKNSSGSNKQRKVSPNSSLTSRIRAAMQHELTSNAISKMYYMSGSIEDSSFTPILQVIYVKKISKEGFGDEERFKVILSDGQHFFSSMTSSQISHLINNGTISKHCILRITEFIINTMGSGAKICVILGAEKLGDNLGRLGAPVDISKVPINQVVVEGCGISAFNGIYKKEEGMMYQHAPIYSKKRLWEGKEVTLAIFMPSATKYNWHIGTWIGDIDGEGGPNNSYYSSTYDSRHDTPPSCVTPPEKDWEVARLYGTNPAPTCRLMRGGN